MIQGFSFVAEREGFEPSVQFPVRQFSKLVLSASQPPLRFLGSAKIHFVHQFANIFSL